MINRIFLVLACVLFQITTVQAATQLKVLATENFNTDNPAQKINVSVVDETQLGSYTIGVNSMLHCNVLKVVEPKRGKRNATFYVEPISYTYNNETIKIDEEMYGKYSRFVLSKEELKKIPSFENMKKAALSIGNFFVKGISVAYSFAEGVVKNEDENRLKSGVKNAYEESPLSYVETGEPVDLKVGDQFYLVFKTKPVDEEE